MIKGLKEIMVFVPDLVEAKIWYGNILGVEPVIDTDVYCQFRVGSTELGFHPADVKTGSGINSTVPYWLVDNLDEFVERAQGMGAELYRGPRVIEGDRKICQLRDPFGNVLGITQLIEGN